MFQSKAKQYWLFQILGWGFVAIILFIVSKIFSKSFNLQVFIYKTILFFVLGILFSHLLRQFIRWRKWLILPGEKVIPKLIVSTIILAFVASFPEYAILKVFSLLSTDEKVPRLGFLKFILGSTFDSCLFYLPWVFLYYMYHFIDKSRREKMNLLKMESLIKDLELKSIKAHINPHFIFNSLNSIRALIDENPRRARRAVTELSNILRSSLQMEKHEFVVFEKELDIVKDYLALEHIRFEDRLSIEINVDDNTLNNKIPPMMLQTLVENAIKHGISKQLNGGKITISSVLKNNYQELSIINTGILNKTTNGFGIDGTQNRLTILYGDNAKFSIKQKTPDEVETKLILPYR